MSTPSSPTSRRLQLAFGRDALHFNTTGNYNSAIGSFALYSSTSGDGNTANGYFALYSNTTGLSNTANGFEALFNNTTGGANTANGFYALVSNTTGNNNTANGFYTLWHNNTGHDNTADGYQALNANTTGSFNTAIGVVALYGNTTGDRNIAIGLGAGANLTTGSHNIAIGNLGVAGESGTIRIGTSGTHTATFIAGINGVALSGGINPVYIDANGQLGMMPSSRRFKNAIHTMGPVSERLMQLRPVTFRYKAAAQNGTHPLQYGLIAEEVAKVYPDLVQYDQAGKPLTVYYHLLTPMLLNELQKQHRQNEALKTEISALKSELASLKQSQQQERSALAKLTALIETSQNKAQTQRAIYTKR